MARFVDLVVVEGPDQGMKYTIEEGAYRVVGRAGDPTDSTVHLTKEGDRLLDADQQALVDQLVTSRSARGARTRFRTRGADILIDDESVSRSHAVVFADREGVSVADLMSTNGTKVNGTPVGDVDLQSGDVLHVGQTKFKVEDTRT